MNFGFLPENVCYETEDFQITPLPSIWERLKTLHSEGLIHDGWVYPPVEEPHRTSKDPEKLPKVPWRAFNLSSTHKIEFNNGSVEDNRKEFLINIFGFTKGMKLIPSHWLHFYRVQIELHKSIGFVCTKEETQKLLSLGNIFYEKHNIETRKVFFGAVHWYLFVDSYYHDFEIFDCQYKVLDACYKLCRDIFNIKNCNHSERPAEMCRLFDMPIPKWAKLNEQKSDLSILRNQFYHEALFAGEPIGFNMPDGSLVFELKNFNAKLLLSILGVKAEYIKFPADQEYCMHALGMGRG